MLRFKRIVQWCIQDGVQRRWSAFEEAETGGIRTQGEYTPINIPTIVRLAVPCDPGHCVPLPLPPPPLSSHPIFSRRRSSGPFCALRGWWPRCRASRRTRAFHEGRRVAIYRRNDRRPRERTGDAWPRRALRTRHEFPECYAPSGAPFIRDFTTMSLRYACDATRRDAGSLVRVR